MDGPTVEERARRVFEGPTVAFDRPSQLAVLFVGGGDPAIDPGLRQALGEALPGWEAPGAEVLASGGPGAGLAQDAGRLVAALMRQAGTPAMRVIARAASAPDGLELRLHHDIEEQRVAALCARTTAATLRALLRGEGEALRAALEEHRRALGPPPGYRRMILREVRRRGWELTELAPGFEPLVMVGSGSRQRRFLATLTDRTSRIASDLSSDKAAASRQMRRAGLPTPEQELAGSLDAARAAARRIGFPVAVKPVGMDKGVGVTAWAPDDAALAAAFALAAPHGPVIVERHIPGDTCRLFVVEGVLKTAFAVRQAHVVGDGRSSVRQLLEAANRDRERWRREGGALPDISVEDETVGLLTAQGLDWDAVAPADLRVRLRSISNLAAGGVTEDLTARVHPAVARMAERAARAVGLDVAGVDYISTDIGRPPQDVGGAICEINPHPGLRLSTYDGVTDIVGGYVDGFGPQGASLAIPQIVVYGAPPDAAIGALEAALGRFGPVGAASPAGVRIGGVEAAPAGTGAWRGARIVLEDPLSAAAVLQVGALDILRDGLPATHACRVLMMDLDARGVSEDVAAQAARLLLRHRRGPAVLNRDDPAVRALGEAPGAGEIVWVSLAAEPGVRTADARDAAARRWMLAVAAAVRGLSSAG